MTSHSGRTLPVQSKRGQSVKLNRLIGWLSDRIGSGPFKRRPSSCESAKPIVTVKKNSSGRNFKNLDVIFRQRSWLLCKIIQTCAHSRKTKFFLWFLRITHIFSSHMKNSLLSDVFKSKWLLDFAKKDKKPTWRTLPLMYLLQ